MLYRKIETSIREYFSGDMKRALVISGARQVGKSYIIRHVGQECFKNFIELNFIANEEIRHAFEKVGNTEDFYFTLSTIAGTRLGSSENTPDFVTENLSICNCLMDNIL